MKLSEVIAQSRTAFILFAEIISGLAISLAFALIFFRLSTEVFDQDAMIYDHALSLFVYSFRSPLFTKLMIIITNLGSNYLLIALVLTTIFLVWKKHHKEAVLFVLVTLMGFFLNFSLKQLIHRPRPALAPLIFESSYSYPSGHAMNSFVFYATLAFYFYHFTRRRLLSAVVSIFSVVIILLIGFSRVYLGVHYPTDVLAGYFVGFWWFITAIVIERTMVFRRIFRETNRQ